MQKDSIKLKITAFSILFLVTISPLVAFQKIDAQPLNPMSLRNLTLQQNLTEPLSSADEFKCIISPDQPTDPVEMNLNFFDAFSNQIWVMHTEKEVFECASPVSSIPPPIKRDVSITTVGSGSYTNGFGFTGFYGNMCDRSLQGNVTSCTASPVGDFNATALDCREDPIQHPIEMYSAGRPVFDRESPILDATIISETHEYKCGQARNPDKIKVVTIFSFPGVSTSLAATCIKDVLSATVESCSAKLVGSNLGINNSKSISPTTLLPLQ